MHCPQSATSARSRLLSHIRKALLTCAFVVGLVTQAHAFAYVADIAQGVQGGGTTVSTNTGQLSATATGDLMYMAVPYNNQGTVSFGAGAWSRVGRVTQSGGTYDVYCLVAPASIPGSYTITFGTSTASITTFYDVKGGPAACGSEAFTSLTGTAATSFTGPTITPTGRYSLVMFGASQTINGGSGSNIIADLNIGLNVDAYPFRWGLMTSHTYMWAGLSSVPGLKYVSTNSDSQAWQGWAMSVPSATIPATSVNRYLPIDGMFTVKGTATGTITASNPPSIPNGDQGVIDITYDSNSITLTPPSGWTLAHACSVASGGTTCWYIHTAASESLTASYAFSASNTISDAYGSIFYLHNVTVAAVDAYAEKNALSQAEVIAAPTITPSQSGDVICHGFFNDQTSGSGGGNIRWNVPNTPMTGGITNADAEPVGVLGCFIEPDALAAPPMFAGFNDSSGANGFGTTIAFKTTSPASPSGACPTQLIRGINQAVTAGTAQTDAPIVVPYGTQANDVSVGIIDTGGGITVLTGPVGWTQIEAGGNVSNNESSYYRVNVQGDPPFVDAILTGGAAAWLGGTVSLTGTVGLDVASINTANSSDGSGNMPNTGVTTLKSPDLIISSWIVSNTDNTSVALPNTLTSLWNYGTDTVAAGYLCAAVAGAQAAQTAVASNTSKAYSSTMAAFYATGAVAAGVNATLFGPICGFHGDSCGN